jgi:hypothetical protein
VITGLLVLAIGIAITVAGPFAIGLFVIACVPLGWMLAFTQVVLVRRAGYGHRDPAGEAGGVVLLDQLRPEILTALSAAGFEISPGKPGPGG